MKPSSNLPSHHRFFIYLIIQRSFKWIKIGGHLIILFLFHLIHWLIFPSTYLVSEDEGSTNQKSGNVSFLFKQWINQFLHLFDPGGGEIEQSEVISHFKNLNSKLFLCGTVLQKTWAPSPGERNVLHASLCILGNWRNFCSWNLE